MRRFRRNVIAASTPMDTKQSSKNYSELLRDDIRRCVDHSVSLFLQRDYDSIRRQIDESRISLAEIQSTLVEYPDLGVLTDEAFNKYCAVYRVGPSWFIWQVDAPLSSDTGAIFDLSLGFVVDLTTEPISYKIHRLDIQ